MILGIGSDIIEVERIEQAISRNGPRFLDKLFTKNEQDYCLKHNQSSRHFAGRFAAKEAIVKALGTGFIKEVNWLDIEILNDSLGKPVVTVSESIKKAIGFTHILVTISHCKNYATAFAICEA